MSLPVQQVLDFEQLLYCATFGFYLLGDACFIDPNLARAGDLCLLVEVLGQLFQKRLVVPERAITGNPATFKEFTLQ